MSNPFFSIIIPTYNRAGFIEKTINSVLNQTYTNFEVIIVDDGSTDNTKQVVASINDKRIRYYRKENAERGAARNFGIEKAKGKYITFLDSDDLFYDNHLIEATIITQKYDNVKFFHLGYEIVDSKGINIEKINTRTGDINKKLLEGNSLSCIGVFVASSVIKKVKFSEDRNFRNGEDWLLWLKIAARNKLYYSNKITACLVHHDSRSVNTFNEIGYIYSIDVMLKELKADNIFMKKYGKYIHNIHAHMLSYTALHAALANKRLLAIKYLWLATVKNPAEFFKRRTVAIFKQLF